MGSYVALDVSLRSTSVHIVDEAGKRLWRGKCASEPQAIVALVRRHAPEVVRVGLETGFLSTWLCHALAEAGLPIVCMDARHAKAVLSVTKPMPMTPRVWRSCCAPAFFARSG
jgi:transposase